MKTINNFLSKLGRTVNMLFDKSEVFDDNPSFRYQIIINIWKS
jgi:hypothetical protein